jgi:hypothetical protein
VEKLPRCFFESDRLHLCPTCLSSFTAWWWDESKSCLENGQK